MAKTFPTLFHLGKNKALYSYNVWSENDKVYSDTGQVDGQRVQSVITVFPKNVGRANATTAEEQADKEALAKHTHKLKRKYSLTPEDAKEEEVAPMLAQSFEKRKHKDVRYPIDAQPKLDGCFTYNASIVTDNGHMKLGNIVENKLPVNVLSLNMETNIFEFKPITNYFNNGLAPQQDWCEIYLENKRNFKCTWNHKILTQNGFKEAKDLNNEFDRIACKTSDSRIMGLLLGTLLGDSCLQFDKRNKNISPRLIFSHTNKELFDHKIKVLNLPGKINEYTTGYGSIGYRFCSSNNIDADLEEFYYTNSNSVLWGKRKPIKQSILRNYLTKEGLSLWIADDGSLRFNNGNKETPILQIATHSQTEAELDEIIAYFNSVWGVNPSKIKNTKSKITNNGGNYFLNFKSNDTVYLLSRLRNVVWKGAEYKFFFNDLKLVEPTTSELSFLDFRIQKSRKSSKITKYDIEVADNHNYIVNGAIVHNCRALARWDGEKIILTSRGYQEWTEVPHINEELKKYLQPGDILDGELYCHGYSFQTLTSWMKRSQPETSLIEYHVYDMPSHNGEDSLSWEQRRTNLITFFKCKDFKNIKYVETFTFNNEDELLEKHQEWVSLGYEGSMARNHDGLYQYGYRSYDLLKLKDFYDGEYKVIGVTSGKGKFEGCAIWICEDEKGRSFKVTPKATQEEKEEMYRNADNYIGRMLTIKYTAFTDDGLPKCANGMHFRMDKDLPK